MTMFPISWATTSQERIDALLRQGRYVSTHGQCDMPRHYVTISRPEGVNW
jgi:hypothetical protein